MTVLLMGSCVSEIKPILKPAEVDIPTRVAEQQKWLDQYIKTYVISRADALPIQKELGQIKEKYDRLKSAGTITDKDSKSLNRKLDETSDLIFRLTHQGKK
jgi:hypothetical protein